MREMREMGDKRDLLHVKNCFTPPTCGGEGGGREGGRGVRAEIGGRSLLQRLIHREGRGLYDVMSKLLTSSCSSSGHLLRGDHLCVYCEVRVYV